MVVHFIGGPKDGLIMVSVNENTYELRFPVPVPMTVIAMDAFTPTGIFAKYVYRRDLGTDVFKFAGIRE